MSTQDIRKQLRPMLENLCAKVSAYEHSYGQAREEALADYGNCFNTTFATIDQALKRDNTTVSPDEYAQYYHAAKSKGLTPYSFVEYQLQCSTPNRRKLDAE